MMLRCTLEPRDRPMSVCHFCQEANLHQLSMREIFGIGCPGGEHVTLDIVRQCRKLHEARLRRQSAEHTPSTGASGLQHGPVGLPRQVGCIADRCNEAGPKAADIEIVTRAEGASRLQENMISAL